MRVGILGSGDVGKALAIGFAAEGHEVMIATRDTTSQKAKDLEKELDVKVGNFSETAAYAELAVLCTAWVGTEEAIRLAGPEELATKVVVDATNPLDFSTGTPQLALGHTDSGGEQVQRWLENSQVVKAFNTVGHGLMYHPSYEHGEPTMFICGNKGDSKESVRDILHLFGWDVVDMGDITSSRELESLALLWVKYGRLNGTWTHAFKLLAG